MPQMSGLDLVMTGMPGMASHAPMKIAGFKTSVSQDGKSLVAALPRPLPAGTYDAHWHVVSTDTHRVAGPLTFTDRKNVVAGKRGSVRVDHSQCSMHQKNKKKYI